MAAWVKHRRKGGKAAEPTPLITLRRDVIAFNAHFVVAAQIGVKLRATARYWPAPAKRWRLAITQ